MKALRALFTVVIGLTLLTAGVALGAPSLFTTVDTVQTYTYSNVTAADNNAILSRKGILGRVTINSVTTSGTITIYDNTTCAGTKIATIASPFVGMSLPYGIWFTTGLCINTGASTNMDLTVSYK